MKEKKASKKKVETPVAEAPATIPAPPVAQVAKAVEKKPERPMNVYLLLFRIKGHTTWRTNIYGEKEQFDLILKKQPKHPEVTERRWFVVDSINGTVIPE